MNYRLQTTNKLPSTEDRRRSWIRFSEARQILNDIANFRINEANSNTDNPFNAGEYETVIRELRISDDEDEREFGKFMDKLNKQLYRGYRQYMNRNRRTKEGNSLERAKNASRRITRKRGDKIDELYSEIFVPAQEGVEMEDLRITGN